MSAERVWLCWSASQQAVHIELESEGCRFNQLAFDRNLPTDFVPLAVFPSREAASVFAGEIQEIRNNRQSLLGAELEGGAK